MNIKECSEDKLKKIVGGFNYGKAASNTAKCLFTFFKVCK